MEDRHPPASDSSATPTLPPRGTAASGGAADPIFLPDDLVAGRFRAIRLLGQGGMAQVFAAADLELGQQVAIKVVRPELAATLNARDLLRREVLLARRITHPNVCRIFDVFQHTVAPPAGGGSGAPPSTLVLVMELISGETLAQRLARGGRLPPAEALVIIRQLAGALDAAHRSQVAHGDLKSSNVMLERSAGGLRAVVTDFGLAQHAAARTRQVRGSTPYMAPELCRRGRVTPASDIYALGVVIHEMVAGQRPDRGRRPARAGARQAAEARAAAAPALPAAWNEVLDRCLAASPRHRPGSAGAVADLLAAGIDARSPSTTRATAMGSRLRLLVRAALLCTAAACLRLGPPAGPPAPTTRAAAVAGNPGLAAPAAAPRPAIAVGGLLASPAGGAGPWLAPALSHRLVAELRGGGEIEVIRLAALPAGIAAAARPDLPQPGPWQPADLLVSGSVQASPGGADPTIRIDLRVRRAASRAIVAALTESASLSRLAAAVARLGDRLRRLAGVAPASPADRAAALALCPSSLQAEGLYEQGESFLARGELVESQAALLRALAADDAFALSHAALARVYGELGYDQRARQEAAAAEQRSRRLPERQRLAVAAVSRRTANDARGAAGLCRVLWSVSPHDADLGLQLAETQLAAADPRNALETLQAIRARGVEPARAPYLDLLEARVRNRLADHGAALAPALAAEQGASRAGGAFVLAAAEVEEADARTAAGDAAGATRALTAAQDLYRRLGFRGGLGETARRLATLEVQAGRAQQALALDQQALAIFEETGTVKGSAQVLVATGEIWQQLGEFRRAERLIERALAACRSVGDRADEANTLISYAKAIGGRAAPARIEKLLQDAVSLEAEIGNRRGVMRALNYLAFLELGHGDLDAARVHFEEMLRLAREMRMKSAESIAELNLGAVWTAAGDLRAARPHLVSCLRLARESHRPDHEVSALRAFAALLAQEGDLAGAEDALRRALALASQGSQRVEALRTLGDLVRLQLQGGKFAEAESTVRTAMEEQRQIGYHRPSQLLWALLAEAQLGQGRLAPARRSLGVAESRPQVDKTAETQLPLALAAARLALAEKRPLYALHRLEDALRRFSSTPNPDLLFEARGLAAEAALDAGRTAQGCGALRSLAQAASGQGFAFAARRSERILGATAACQPPPVTRDG